MDIGPRVWLQAKMERLCRAGFSWDILELTPGFIGLYISASEQWLYQRLRPMGR